MMTEAAEILAMDGHLARHSLDRVLSRREILRRDLGDLQFFDRALLRGMALMSRRQVVRIDGLAHIQPGQDPFILALNHSSRGEALYVPAILVLLRNGERLHFFADWNFRMIPGMNYLYRRAGAITVPRKAARPRFLNRLKPYFTDEVAPMTQAGNYLRAGGSVGIFPEGTVNPCRKKLLRGRYGTARLAIETQAPVVPAGIRFPSLDEDSPIVEGTPFEIRIGAPMVPPAVTALNENRDLVRRWHGDIMGAIGRLSGKAWTATA